MATRVIILQTHHHQATIPKKQILQTYLQQVTIAPKQTLQMPLQQPTLPRNLTRQMAHLKQILLRKLTLQTLQTHLYQLTVLQRIIKRIKPTQLIKPIHPL